jgi:hypothetical protein
VKPNPKKSFNDQTNTTHLLLNDDHLDERELEGPMLCVFNVLELISKASVSDYDVEYELSGAERFILPPSAPLPY